MSRSYCQIQWQESLFWIMSQPCLRITARWHWNHQAELRIWRRLLPAGDRCDDLRMKGSSAWQSCHDSELLLICSWRESLIGIVQSKRCACQLHIPLGSHSIAFLCKVQVLGWANLLPDSYCDTMPFTWSEWLVCHTSMYNVSWWLTTFWSSHKQLPNFQALFPVSTGHRYLSSILDYVKFDILPSLRRMHISSQVSLGCKCLRCMPVSHFAIVHRNLCTRLSFLHLQKEYQ